jgi:plasmid stabilization system protein ParE
MQVRWLRTAIEEAREARRFYEARRKGLGKRFHSEVAATVRRIRELPTTWPEVDPPVRRALVNRFPYSVHYAIEGSAILIIGVYHGKQRPISWRDRLK